MKKLVGLFLTPLLLTAPAVAVAKPDSSFGRMFAVVAKSSDKGALAALNQQTNQQLADLAQTMLETSAIPNPEGTTGGVTFFGQFIDHDLTLDTAPSADRAVNVEGLLNARSFPFDLDSVYGGGPKKSPQLYDGDKFKIGTAADRVSPDLPRSEWLRNSGGAPQRREPDHLPDSSGVPAVSQRAHGQGYVVRPGS